MRLPITLCLLLFATFLHAQEVPVLEFAKSIGTTSLTTSRDMFRDASGNIYIVGDFWNTIDFDPGPGVANLTSLGGYDIFVAKYDPTGNYIWAKSFGGTRYNFGYGITVDDAGNVYTTGWTDGTVDFDPGPGVFNLSANNGSGYYDVFISKLDSNGDFVWAKSMGGSGSDEGMGIKLDASGNIYIAGSYAYTVDFDPNAGVYNLISPDFDAIFIAKYDNDGNLIWAKSIDGSFNQEAYNLSLDADGNVYTTGRLYGTPAYPVDFDPGSGVFNLAPDQNAFFVSKLDNDGNFVWAKLIEGDYGQDIAFDASSNVYVTGKFVGTTDFDPNAGVFNLTSAAGPGDIFVLKLTSTGNFVWAKQMGGTGFTTFSGNENKGYGITIDPSGNVLTTGVFAGTGDFDPGVGTLTLTAGSNNYPNAFISKLDSDGNLIWATSLGGTTEDFGHSITTDASGNIYAAGKHAGTVDFDPGPCVYNIVGGYSPYIWKLSLGTAIPAPTITSFTPNAGPVGTTVTITGTNFSSAPSVTFYNNRATTISASTTTSITTTVPASSSTGKISITANCMTVQTATNFTVGAAPMPTITSFTPSSGPIGTTVTITGTNFSTTPANNAVAFNGTASVVTASTATSITTTVPAGATTGKITVTVSGNTATSTPNFTVTAAPMLNITSQPVNFPACPGDIATFTTSATGTTNITYRWQIEDDGIFTDVSDGNGYSGTTTSSFSINTSQNNGVGIFRCRINGDGASQLITHEVSVTLKQNCAGNEPPVIQPRVSAVLAGGIITIDLKDLVSDPDDNLDFITLYTSTSTEQGATALLDDFSFILTLNYGSVQFIGTDHITVGICDSEGECVEEQLAIEVGGDIEVYNAVSPNGDLKNEMLILRSIDVIPDAANNYVTIFNRWGDLVFEIKNYNNADRVFKGLGKNGNELPSGTYYYKIEFTGGRKTQTGYLSLKR